MDKLRDPKETAVQPRSTGIPMGRRRAIAGWLARALASGMLGLVMGGVGLEVAVRSSRSGDPTDLSWLGICGIVVATATITASVMRQHCVVSIATLGFLIGQLVVGAIHESLSLLPVALVMMIIPSAAYWCACATLIGGLRYALRRERESQP